MGLNEARTKEVTYREKNRAYVINDIKQYCNLSIKSKIKCEVNSTNGKEKIKINVRTVVIGCVTQELLPYCE